MSNNFFLVRVSCLTYNHAPYITDAMNGFCMQETKFPFVCTIIDDASEDGEPEVIKKFLEENFDFNDSSITLNENTDDYFLRFARHKINHNCFFYVLLLKYNHYSIKKTKVPYIKDWCKNTKYIALCEGDDYWSDPNKLQKQIDFLESHPDYTMVHTGFMNINNQGVEYYDPFYEGLMKKSFSGFILSQLFKGNYILTLTVCLRRTVYHSDLFINSPKIDYSTFLSASFQGNVHYINDKTGYYRHHELSISHTNRPYLDKIIRSTFDYYLRALFQGADNYLSDAKRKLVKRNLIKHFVINNKSYMLNGYQYLSLSDTIYYYYCISLRCKYRINTIIFKIFQSI